MNQLRMTMHRFSPLPILAFAIALTGCAAYEPVPKGYTGPTANIADGIQPRTESVANAFALVEIDGQSISNSFVASAQASQGQGFKLTARGVDRDVPAVPLKLKLKAQPMTGAPIQAMAMKLAGTFYTVEGNVNFTPQAGGRYIVRGELTKEVAAIWIEDATTGQVLTEKLLNKPSK